MRLPLVFVHGFMGGSRQWALQAPLGHGRDLICVDLPGFGKNAHREPISRIEGFAEWVLQKLTADGIERFDLIGHSMGGMIVQEMVRQAPQCINRLVLYGTGAVGVLPGRFETIEQSIDRAVADGAGATARRIAATWFLRRDAAREYAACAEIAALSSLPAIIAGLNAMKAWSGEDNLANITMPTLIIWGDGDRTYPWAQTERLWQTIPNTNLFVAPDCAHAVHLEYHSVFNQVVGRFLHGWGD